VYALGRNISSSKARTIVASLLGVFFPNGNAVESGSGHRPRICPRCDAEMLYEVAVKLALVIEPRGLKAGECGKRLYYGEHLCARGRRMCVKHAPGSISARAPVQRSWILRRYRTRLTHVTSIVSASVYASSKPSTAVEA
jgi:hypothetical protein